MRAFLIILKRSLKNRITFTVSIFFLSMITAIFLISSIGIIIKISNVYEQSYKSSQESDLIYGFAEESFKESFITYFNEALEVESSYTERALFGKSTIEDDTTTLIISTNTPIYRNYQIAEHDDEKIELKENEVLLPLSFKDEYQFNELGHIKLSGTDFIIKAFFEDPVYGSPLYHSKRVIISTEMFEKMENSMTENDLQYLKFLNVNLKENFDVSDEVIIELMQSFDEQYIYEFDRLSVTELRTTVPRIVLIILTVFAFFLFLIMVIVIRYAILTSIEDEYASLGIMKAFGMTNLNISLLLLTQYLVIVLVGLIFGIGITLFVAPMIGKYLLSISGILWVGNLDFIQMIQISIIFLLLISLIVYTQTQKAGRVRPIEAIVYGKSENIKASKWLTLYNKYWINIPISIRMTIRQLRTGGMQYFSLFLLTIIFSFMSLSVIGLNIAFNSSEKVASILGYDLIDIKLEITNKKIADEEDIDEILVNIEDDYGIEYKSIYDTDTKVYIDNNKIQALIYDEFQKSNIISGNSPQSGNEVMISSGISKKINKDVGDYIDISLSKDGDTEHYQISGINNQVYTLGKNISLSREGYERLDEKFIPYKFLVKIKENNELDKKVEEIESMYIKEETGIVISNELYTTLNRITSITNMLNMMTMSVVIISLILISLITFLVSLVIIKRENVQLGILKSVGFTSYQIRLQFVLRFLVVSITGSGIGIALNCLIGNTLISWLFLRVGLSNIAVDVPMLDKLYIMIFISIVTIFSSMIVSKKIKKVSTKVLVME